MWDDSSLINSSLIVAHKKMTIYLFIEFFLRRKLKGMETPFCLFILIFLGRPSFCLGGGPPPTVVQ